MPKVSAFNKPQTKTYVQQFQCQPPKVVAINKTNHVNSNRHTMNMSSPKV